jgi:hypothetical protein
VDESDEQVMRTLLLEAHRCVEGAAGAAVAKIGLPRLRVTAANDLGIDPDALLIYPPDNILSPQEEDALRSMQLSPVQRSALKKLIADGCATAFFDWFNLLDGTSAPEVGSPGMVRRVAGRSPRRSGSRHAARRLLRFVLGVR